MTDAIAFDGLVRRFGERAALDGVTLRVPAGRTLAVFGANGAGKTTLLRILATLLRPHGGEARVLGAALPREGWRVRGRIGLLAHEPLLYRELTARENLRFHARLHRVAPGRIEALLEAVGLAARGDEPVRTLSRGLVQRVAICRAVLHEPELLLLDEPYANLDPAAVERVAPLIGGFVRPSLAGARTLDDVTRFAATEPAFVRPSIAGARTLDDVTFGARTLDDATVTRVLISHDVESGLAEADLVLGLRGGRPVLLAAAGEVAPGDLRGLYR